MAAAGAVGGGAGGGAVPAAELEALRAGGAWGAAGPGAAAGAGDLEAALAAVRAACPELLEGLRGGGAALDPQDLAREVLARAAARFRPAAAGPHGAGAEGGLGAAAAEAVAPAPAVGALGDVWAALEGVRARLAALPAGGFCAEEERQFALRFAPYAFGAADDPRRDVFQELRETAVEDLVALGPGTAPYRAGAGDSARAVLAELASRGALSCAAEPSEAARKGVKREQGEGGGGGAYGHCSGRFGAFEFAVRLSDRVVAGVAGLGADDDDEVDWVGQVRRHACEDFDGVWAAEEALEAGPGVPLQSSLCRAVWEGFFGTRVCPERGVPLPRGQQGRQERVSWHRAEVRDPAGVALGSLSQSDVLAHIVSKGMSLGQMFFMPLRELAGQASSLRGEWGRLLTERSSLVVVDADMPLAYALHRLGRAGMECAAVLDRRGGELVGTLSPKSLRFFQAGHEAVLALPVGLFLAQVFSRAYGKHHPSLAAGGPAAEPFFAAHARESRSVLCGTVPAVAESEPLLVAMEAMMAQRERCCWLKGEGGELSGALFLPDLLRFLCSCPLRKVAL